MTLQDKDYRLIGYNREFAERFDPLPGDYCYRAYKGRTEKCDNCPVEKTFADGLSHYSEESGRTKDGTPSHWIVKTAPLRDAQGEIVGAMEMSLDITSRKELENRLAHSEKKYCAIFNNIPDPVFVIDADSYEILDCNSSVMRVYGYATEELLGRSFMDLFPAEERERCAESFKTDSVIEQIRQLNKAGGTLFVHLRLSPSEDVERRVLLVTTCDMRAQLAQYTERLERMVEEKTRQLIEAERMIAIGQTITGLSHTIKQIASGLKGGAYGVEKGLQLNQQRYMRQGWQIIKGNVDKIARLSLDLLNYARTTQQHQARWCDPNGPMEDVAVFIRPQADAARIDLDLDLCPQPAMVAIDPDTIYQAVLNLAVNAMESFAGSDAAYPRKIRLKSSQPDGWAVVYQVSDNGCGMDKRTRERACRCFFTTKGSNGTGIGLMMTKNIVDRHGGEILFRTSPGKGADVVVRLPKGDPSAPQSPIITNIAGAEGFFL